MQKKTFFFIFFLLFIIVLPINVYSLDYQDYVISCTNTSRDTTSANILCENLYDKIGLSGVSSENEWIAERDATHPDRENVTLNFGSNVLLYINNLSVDLSCLAGGNQNPEAIEIYARNINTDIQTFIGSRSFIPYPCGDLDCNSNEPHNYNINISDNIVSGFNELTMVINRSNCTIIDGVNELWVDFSSNTTNELPEVNITINNTEILCLENTSNPIRINLTINVFDNENDVIYYGEEIYENKNYEEVVYFNEQSCFLFFCSNSPVYDFISKLYYENGNECRVSREGLNTSQFNLVQYPEDKYLLALSSTCEGEQDKYVYTLNNPISRIAYKTKFYGLTQENETVNFTFYDSSYNRITEFGYKVNGTQINFFNNGTTKYNFTPSQDYIEFILNTYLEDNFFYVVSLEDNYVLNSSNYLPSSLVKYIEVNVENGTVIYQDDFYISGYSASPVWTTTQPSVIEIDSIGTQQFLYYVTDSVHLNTDEYLTEIIYVNVYDSDNLVCDITYGQQQNVSILAVYENVNGYTGMYLIFDTFVYYSQIFYRVFNHLGWLNFWYFAIVIGLFLFGYEEYNYLREKTEKAMEYTVYSIFFIASIFMIMRLMYVDLFIILSFVFAIYLEKNVMGEKHPQESAMKQFLTIYLIFTFLMVIVQLSGTYNLGFNNFNRTISFTIEGIFNLIIEVFETIFSLLTWTISAIEVNLLTQYFILFINGTLWVFRIFLLIEFIKIGIEGIKSLPFT